MSNYILLDTHVLVWLVRGHDRLGRDGRRQAHLALQEDCLFVSAISFWEVALLVRRGRIELPYPTDRFRRTVVESGVIEMPMTGDIGIVAAELDGFHADPADRIITATALVRGCSLLTADDRILGWNGPVMRHDARR